MPHDAVVLHLTRPRDFLATHEGHALAGVAQTLAGVLGCRYDGCHDDVARPGRRLYFVPDETLIAADSARLGIASTADLFGGVVPYELLATKAITHGLVAPDSARPREWPTAFARRVADVVLPGFTVFDRRDARTALARLLPDGPVRAKRPRAAGGHGQAVVTRAADLEAILALTPEEELASFGLVLEKDLEDATTLSIGRVTLGALTVTYWGVQLVTKDNAGRTVYGGSDLMLRRGGWEAFDDGDVPTEVRRALDQARRYDEAAESLGLVASRRNYDVIQGLDREGRWRSGVLEQGWRAGGASGAEAVALEAFAREPGLDRVRAACVERYGEGLVPPPDAVVHFAGVDPVDGPMIRYARVERPEAPLS